MSGVLHYLNDTHHVNYVCASHFNKKFEGWLVSEFSNQYSSPAMFLLSCGFLFPIPESSLLFNIWFLYLKLLLAFSSFVIKHNTGFGSNSDAQVHCMAEFWLPGSWISRFALHHVIKVSCSWIESLVQYLISVSKCSAGFFFFCDKNILLALEGMPTAKFIVWLKISCLDQCIKVCLPLHLVILEVELHLEVSYS